VNARSRKKGNTSHIHNDDKKIENSQNKAGEDLKTLFGEREAELSEQIDGLKDRLAEKDAEIALKTEEYARLLKKYEASRSENFDRESFVAAAGHEMRRERSRAVYLSQELSEIKTAFRAYRDKTAALAAERNFLAGTLRKTADDYGELIEMTAGLKNDAQRIQAEKDERTEAVLFEFYQTAVEKDREIALAAENYTRALKKYEASRGENFDRVSFVAAAGHELRRERSRAVYLKQELSDIKAAFRAYRDKTAAILGGHNFLAGMLRKTADDYGELIEMTAGLKNDARKIQAELDETKRELGNLGIIHTDTLESAKFKIGAAVAGAMKNPLKIFLLPAKFIKIFAEKKKYDKRKKAEKETEKEKQN